MKHLTGNIALALDQRRQLRRRAPVSIAIADADPLHDEGEGLAARLESAGVPVRLRRYAGMVHGFAGLSALTPIAGQALSAMANDLKAALTA